MTFWYGSGLLTFETPTKNNFFCFKVFLLIRIRTSDKWIQIRIQEAKNIWIQRIRIHSAGGNTEILRPGCLSYDPG
jgi:hypothetical protein